MTDWHYKDKTDIKGPFTDEQIVALFEVEAINMDTEVWRPGQDIWRKASEVEDFPKLTKFENKTHKAVSREFLTQDKVDEEETRKESSVKDKDVIKQNLPAEVTKSEEAEEPLYSLDKNKQFSIIFGAIAVITNIVSIVTLDSRDDYQKIIYEFKNSTLTPASAIAQLIFWISFLVWVYRSTANLHTKGFQGLKIRPGWAIGWWFVPIAFFWKPFQALSQIERTSFYTTKWQNKNSSKFLKIFWIFYLISLALTIFVIYVSATYLSSSDGRFVLNISIYALFCEAICILLLMIFIWRISKKQAGNEFRSVKIISQSDHLKDKRSDRFTINKPYFNFTSYLNLTWWQKAGLIAGVLLLFKLINSDFSTSSSSWKISKGVDPLSDERVTRIVGKPSAHDGRVPPIFIIRCGQKGISVYIKFGVPMQNTYKGGKAQISTVDLRLGSSKAMPLAFVPSNDWTTLYSLDPSNMGDALSGLAVGLDNLIFNALGVKNRPIAGWNAKKLVAAMAQSNILTLRGSPRYGSRITAQYDLSDLSDLYSKLPSYCRN